MSVGPSILSNHTACKRVLRRLILIALLSTSQQICNAYEEEQLTHVQSFQGQVGNGNFTYYRLTLDGCVVIRLDSLLGDADLYVSSSSLKPTWEAYDSKSTTCGIDEVVIYPSQSRPVGIGVYGYIVSDVNTFELSVYIDPYFIDPYPEPEDSDKGGDENEGNFHHAAPGERIQAPSDGDEEESILWTIFVGFLKILFDILL